MTDREVQRILRQLEGSAQPRPGFEQELGELLAAELEEEEPDARGILRLIDGPVAPRPGFRAELGAMLAAELERTDRAAIPAGSAARQRGRLGRLVANRGGWWMQSAAAVVALAIVASGFAWSNCLQTIGPPATEVAGPEAPGEAVDVPSAEQPAQSGAGDRSPDGRPDDGTGKGGGGRADVSSPPAVATDPSSGGGGPIPEEPPPADVPPATPPDPAAGSPAVLAFAGKGTDGYWHIFTMDEHGAHRRQITHGPYHDREPEWSPDGKRIAFMRVENVEDHYESSRIFVTNADGSGLRFLTEGAEPVWSPDGRYLAYAGPHPLPLPRSATVWTIRSDGTEARALGLPGSTAEPSWSPRGNLIGFAAILADPGSAVDQFTNVFIARPDGSRVRRLTNDPYACNTSFSPDGRRLAYVALTDSPFDIWSMRPDGTDKLQLTESADFDFYPHWTPDGRRIFFGRDPDGDPHWVPGAETAGPQPSAIWVMNADGSDERRISPPGADDADPAYRPRVPRRKSAPASDG